MNDVVIDIDWVGVILTIAYWVVIAIAAAAIAANRRPGSAIAWVLAIVFIPFLGLFAFLLVGYSKLPQHRMQKQREVTELILARTAGLDLVSHRDEWPSWLASVVTLNTTLGALPMVGGNRVTLIDDYTASFDRMIEAIDTATDYVHVEFFILVKDHATTPFFEALGRATARGVEVRVLSDWLSGLLYPLRKDTQKYLREIGAEWHPMLPVRPWRGQWQRPDLRNHRKLVVVDGRVGFSGSQNLIDASYLKPGNIKRGLSWHELMMRIEGPAVRELNAVFITDWYSECGVLLPFDASPIVLDADPTRCDAQVLPSGPSFDNDNNLKLFTTLLHKADARISITSPYFVPDEAIMLAVVSAASRGLDVELFVSEIGDQALVYHAQRSYYEPLLRAGVRIYLYKAPLVLHSKHFTIDDDVAVIGSSNMDIRSFSLNAEVSVLLHGREFVDRVRAVEDDYRANSRELLLADWVSRPRGERLRDNLARLTSSLQ